MATGLSVSATDRIDLVKPVITPAESARLDASADISVLMERAGLAVALAAAEMGAGYGSRVSILAGPGNNGGDGFVAACFLRARGADVTIHQIGQPKTAHLRTRFARALDAGARPAAVEELRSPDLVIDAVFGGGMRAGLPAGLRSWIARHTPVLSIDVPSGLDPLTGEPGADCFTADRTVTFHALRTGHLLGQGPDRCGAITVADIGLHGGDPTFLVVEAEDAPRPPRPRTAHKWSAGSVLVMGGGRGMVGAAVLAARSALRFGAGAVGVSSPDVELVQAAAPELLAVDDLPSRYKVLVVGPGLGGAAADFVLGVIEDPRPAIFDADALGHLSIDLLRRRLGPTILTPHAEEFRRLTGEEPSPEAARFLALETRTVVLLKGNPTFVTDGGVPWVVTSGGPELATIGTGDVLVGMIAALIGRGLDTVGAARSGAFWHGVAGAELARSGTVTADMLADEIRRHAWETT